MPSETALRWVNRGEGRLASLISSTVDVDRWSSVISSGGCGSGFLAFDATNRYVRSASKACWTALAWNRQYDPFDDRRLLTCSSTNPPIFSLVLTNAATSSSISLSKSSIDRGRGSGAGAGGGGGTEARGVAVATAPTNPLLVAGPSMDVAISSSREVAASSLAGGD